MVAYLKFETYRKRGKGWEYLGVRTAETSRGAALKTSTAKDFNDWVKQFESCLDNVESHWLAKGFLS